MTADLDAVRRVVVEGLRRVVRGAGYRRGVIGLTGRVEEVVVAALAAEALDAAQVRTVVLACPVGLGAAFHRLQLDDGRDIHFFSALPIYEEELDLAIEMGPDALFDLLGPNGVSDLIQIGRPNVAL